MTIIAVGGLRLRRSLNRIVKLLAPVINGRFEALNFAPGNKGKKICYLRLSEDLDPIQVIKRINAIKTPAFQPYAFIPKIVPDLQLASRLRTFAVEPGPGVRVPVLTPKQLIDKTHSSIMREMQEKYTGLYDFNSKMETNGQPDLLSTIGQVVYDRLIEITSARAGIRTILQLSKAYRKKHPEVCDFQLITSSLQHLQDLEGKPRVLISESEIISSPDPNLPYEKAKATYSEYINKITVKILEHISNLSTTVDTEECGEEVDKVKVREQMKNLVPCLPSIISQVVTKAMIQEETKPSTVPIGGEPTLQANEALHH